MSRRAKLRLRRCSQRTSMRNKHRAQSPKTAITNRWKTRRASGNLKRSLSGTKLQRARASQKARRLRAVRRSARADAAVAAAVEEVDVEGSRPLLRHLRPKEFPARSRRMVKL